MALIFSGSENRLMNPSCVALVVDFVLAEGSELFHYIRERGLACYRPCGAFVQLHLDFPGNLLLGFVHKKAEMASRSSVNQKAVIDQLCELLGDDVSVLQGISVQNEFFQVFVGCEQNSAAWRLVHTSGLHAYQTVFDDIDGANAVFAAQLVEGDQKPTVPSLRR